jgi:two-component system sensor histidine kinase/response regulator
LQQVLINLLGNAVKFTERGQVVLEVAPHGTNESKTLLHFAVRDTGIGVPKDKQKQIFEAFAQADASTTRRFGGTGLGLRISSCLIEMMGGNIQLDSTEGTGSCFQFQIAVEVLALEIAGECNIPQTSLLTQGDLGRQFLVLLAEDNPVNQKLAIRILEKAGHRVVAVPNGREALEQVAAQKFDVVLMDVSMPEMDGFEATAAIRKRYPDRKLPIIAMTAHALIGDREMCLASGMDSYLSKPIKSDELLATISLLASRKESIPNLVPTR